MAQFRITQKFSTDSKIPPLVTSRAALSLLDDWVIDVLCIQRKKVALVTHARSLLKFLIPYAQVGGAKYIPQCIPVCLQQFLYDYDFRSTFRRWNRYLLGLPYSVK